MGYWPDQTRNEHQRMDAAVRIMWICSGTRLLSSKSDNGIFYSYIPSRLPTQSTITNKWGSGTVVLTGNKLFHLGIKTLAIPELLPCKESYNGFPFIYDLLQSFAAGGLVMIESRGGEYHCKQTTQPSGIDYHKFDLIWSRHENANDNSVNCYWLPEPAELAIYKGHFSTKVSLRCY